MICARVKPAPALVANIALLLALTSAVRAQTVWSGFSVEFSKPLFGLPTEPENQDRITDNVWLTRGVQRGLFNVRTESGYVDNVSPADTEWATGLMPANSGEAIAAANWADLTFTDWVTAYGGMGSNQLPARLLGNNAVVHLITDDIYLDLQFTEWGGSGGNFAYQRATGTIIPPPTENGDYNENGVVDAADFVVWRNTFGEEVANDGDGADGNRSGTIDSGDYDFWRERFGNMVAGPGFGAAVVPEPAAAVLLLIAIAAANVWGMRTARQVG